MRLIHADDLLNILLSECAELGSQKAWAEKHGLSPAYVSDIIHGRREISDKVAQLLGYSRQVSFKRSEVHGERGYDFP